MAKSNILATTQAFIRGRLIWSNIFQPVSDDFNEKIYKCNILIDKKDAETLQKIDKLGKDFGYRIELEDMDESEYSENNHDLKGKYMLRCKSFTHPDTVDLNGNTCSEINLFNGSYVYVSVNFSLFKYGNNSGVTQFTNNILLVDSGVEIQTKKTAKQDFEKILQNAKNPNFLNDFMNGVHGATTLNLNEFIEI